MRSPGLILQKLCKNPKCKHCLGKKYSKCCSHAILSPLHLNMQYYHGFICVFEGSCWGHFRPSLHYVGFVRLLIIHVEGKLQYIHDDLRNCLISQKFYVLRCVGICRSSAPKDSCTSLVSQLSRACLSHSLPEFNSQVSVLKSCKHARYEIWRPIVSVNGVIVRSELVYVDPKRLNFLCPSVALHVFTSHITRS